jgi:membrane-bound lytic murein transglycosylase D
MLLIRQLYGVTYKILHFGVHNKRHFLYYALMQLLINSSKFLILAVLSCSLLIAWHCGNTEVLGLNYTYMETSLNVSTENTTVWDSLSRELNLDHKAQSSEVQNEIRKLLLEPDKLYNILKAAGPYIYFIHKQTQVKGLPAEIALIPVIESEFNPNDHSKKGATGLWQLMPATARELGVNVKSRYDGRRNIIASTKAALAYFNDLGNNFDGNWYLAIAAYNSGQVRVESAERRAGSHSFWNLHLPHETKMYVPKLLAVAAIVKNPEKYGVQLPPISNKPFFAELKVKKAVTLANIAKSSGISEQTLHTLNPDYNHPVIPSKGTYTLLVPVNQATAVKAQLAENVVLS